MFRRRKLLLGELTCYKHVVWRFGILILMKIVFLWTWYALFPAAILSLISSSIQLSVFTTLKKNHDCYTSRWDRKPITFKNFPHEDRLNVWTLCVHALKSEYITITIVQNNNGERKLQLTAIRIVWSAYGTFTRHVDFVVQDSTITYYIVLSDDRDCWHVFPVHRRSFPNLITFTAITYWQS